MTKNILRTLIYDEEVSLTLADVTAVVGEAIRLHSLTRPAAVTLGKTLALTAFMSACLKEETGAVSVSVKTDGAGGNISVSGNYALHLRGYLDEPFVKEGTTEADCFGRDGTLTVIRSDGYARPFVGACALPQSGSVEDAFEEYYRTSEQLFTRAATVVKLTDDGKCAFAGVAVLQALPFATDETMQKMPSRAELEKIVEQIPSIGSENTASRYFSANLSECTLRTTEYKCNCSREYLAGVLVSLGKKELDSIVEADGEVKVHCHYCNKDYAFTKQDIEKMFS
jgi:molecular chaperone Hsp33